MNALYSIPSGNIGSIACTFIITSLLILGQTDSYARNFLYPCILTTLILGILLIYWWNYHITQTYKKFLRKNELDSLTLLLKERDQEIEYLKSENEKLAGIIHKDNKLLPALSMAIFDSSSFTGQLPISEKGKEASLQLSKLYEEREKILADYQQEILQLPQTAFCSVNAVLSYMQTQALKEHIPYQLILTDDLTSTIPQEISEEDFIHLLSDLLSNALRACENIPDSSIQIYLGKMDGIPGLKIQNKGNIFPIDTLRDFGLVKHTTHADHGGSGIGLMDIWKIKEHYKATLLIEEISLSACRTCITLLFNHKNHYIIQSDRMKELCTCIHRTDIKILSKD